MLKIIRKVLNCGIFKSLYNFYIFLIDQYKIITKDRINLTTFFIRHTKGEKLQTPSNEMLSNLSDRCRQYHVTRSIQVIQFK